MKHVEAEIAVRLLKEFCSENVKGYHQKSGDVSREIVWTLLKLIESDDADKIDIGIRMVLNFFQSIAPINQANLCHQFYLTGNFLLIALLCNTATRMNLPFPSHLLAESSLNITYYSAISQHMMGIGSNNVYNLGIVSDGEISEPRIIPLKRRVQKISMSNTHTLFLTDEGHVFGCGKGTSGQLGAKMRRLVIEADMIFQATDKDTIIDIAAGEGFSVWISHKNIFIAGKFGKIGHESGELQKFKLGIELISLDLLKNQENNLQLIWIGCVEQKFSYCSANDTEFCPLITYPEQEIRKLGSFSTSFASIVPWKSDLELGTKENPLTVTLRYTFTRYDIDKSSDVPIGMLEADVNQTRMYRSVLYSINGLLIDLNVMSYKLFENGEIYLIASTLCLDATNRRPRSTCLYKGRVNLIPEDPDQEYRTVGDSKRYRVILALQEYPNSHGVSRFALSPDAKNLIFIVDKDQDLVYQQEKYYHNLNVDVEKELRKTVSIPEEKKHMLDIEKMNEFRLAKGMPPLELFDVHLPESLNPKSQEGTEKGPNARLNWLEALYPNAEKYFTENEFKNFEKTSLRDFLILNLLSGFDVIPHYFLPVLYAEMIKSGYKKQRFKEIFTFMYSNNGGIVNRFNTPNSIHSEIKQLFQRFLDEYLGQIGLTSSEILPSIYLLRSIEAPSYVDRLNWDLTILSADGEAFPFQWDLLLLHSEYFEMIYGYHEAQGITEIEERRLCKPLTMDFPAKIVSSALRILLEPNHLYDVAFEDLFTLLGLYDNYLIFSALEETITVLFQRANESNCSLIFEFFNNFEQHQCLLLENFLHYPQMLLYWKSSYRVPLKLLRMANEAISQGNCSKIRMKSRKDQKICSPLLLGTVFVQFKLKTVERVPPMQTDGLFFPYNWARLKEEYVATLYHSLKQPATLKDFHAHLLHAKECNTKGEDEDDPGQNGLGLWKPAKDLGETVPHLCALYLDDKKWMERKDVDEEKPKRNRQASTRKSESLAQPMPETARSRQPSENIPSSLEVTASLASLELKEEETEAKQITSRSPGQDSNEQNIDPDFPSVSLSIPEPKTPKEKFYAKGSKYKVVDVFTPKKSSTAPWAGSPSTSTSKSFKEIQAEEAASQIQKSPKSQPILVASRDRKNTWNEASSSTPPAMSLIDIIAEEERRLRPVIKPAKPLEAVATEERAMQELAQLYENQFNGEAVIYVSLAGPGK